VPNPAIRSYPVDDDELLADRVAKLTPGQLDCLRLVDAHLSSKEIAVQLGISPHTVDQRIRQALQILGVERRSQAARLVAQHCGTYQRLIHQPPHIEAEDDSDEPKARSVNRFGTLIAQGRLGGARAPLPSRNPDPSGLPCNRRSQRGVTPGMR